MARIIAVANQKGGVGKTTSTVNLSAAFARMGKRVLMMDLDPQGNATVAIGVDKDDLPVSAYDVLVGDIKARDAVLTTAVENLDLIAANGDLTAAEVDLIDESKGPKKLRKALKKSGINMMSSCWIVHLH